MDKSREGIVYGCMTEGEKAELLEAIKRKHVQIFNNDSWEDIPDNTISLFFDHGKAYRIVVDEKEDYLINQKRWIEENNIKIGYSVKLVSIANSYEKGWNNKWTPSMNKYLFKIGRIEAINKDGIKINFNDNYYYSYPYFALEKVELPNICFSPRFIYYKTYVNTSGTILYKNERKHNVFYLTHEINEEDFVGFGYVMDGGNISISPDPIIYKIETTNNILTIINSNTSKGVKPTRPDYVVFNIK